MNFFLPMSSLDKGRILHHTTRQLGKGLAEFSDSLGLHFKATLLCHSCIPTVQAIEVRVVIAQGNGTYM